MIYCFQTTVYTSNDFPGIHHADVKPNIILNDPFKKVPNPIPDVQKQKTFSLQIKNTIRVKQKSPDKGCWQNVACSSRSTNVGKVAI